MSETNIAVSSTNFNISILDHLKTKNNAPVGNTGHFDNAFDLAGLEGFGTHESTFSDAHRPYYSEQAVSQGVKVEDHFKKGHSVETVVAINT